MASNANNYGERKRMPVNIADKNDRILDLERENNRIKTKENMLNDEITKMQTKLNRIDGLLRNRSQQAAKDGGTFDA